jgi:hypothetical protein
MIPNVILFARDYQAILFPKLLSDKYKSIFVTLTVSEKKLIQQAGHEVAACFEEDFNTLSCDNLPSSYLITSFVTDRFFGRFSPEIRRMILAREIAFWQNIMDKYKPVAVINEIIAIEIAEVMYIEAMKRGIKYFAWLMSPFDNRNFYWLDIPYHAQLNDKVFNNEPDNDSLKFAQSYYDKINTSENVKPFYASNLKSRYNIMSPIKWGMIYIIKTLRSVLFPAKIPYLKSYYFDKTDLLIKISGYFNSLIYSYDKVPANSEIVFYPLHYEPEASILYMSEFNEDQIGLIRNLAKCLKNNQVLVVKEHPQQPGMLLSKRFRELRKSLSNIAYLPSEFSTKKIIQLSELVITQTSTAGWESLILGKPVVVMGKVFYDKHPQVNIFSDFSWLKQIIHSQEYLYPEKEKTLQLIAQLWHYSREGNPYPHAGLYNDMNINKIRCAIEEKLMEECSTD